MEVAHRRGVDLQSGERRSHRDADSGEGLNAITSREMRSTDDRICKLGTPRRAYPKASLKARLTPLSQTTCAVEWEEDLRELRSNVWHYRNSDVGGGQAARTLSSRVFLFNYMIAIPPTRSVCRHTRNPSGKQIFSGSLPLSHKSSPRKSLLDGLSRV